MLRSLVMLIAIRTPKIAAVRNLKCDIAACTAGFRKVSAVQSLDCISVVLKSLVFQGDGPPPCRNRIGIGHIADRSGQYLLAFDILFWTGCREGEMLALLPKDLTDDDQLRIYKTYHRKKGQDILGPTKNSKKGGNRNVPIPHWLAEEFRTYCSKLYGLTPDDRVFYMTCTALNKELTRCTQLTYLPDIRVHDLRHSHVSLCIELGYSIVLVAKRIGDTVPVVMRTYAHLYPNKQRELVSRLETLSTSSSSKDESDLMPLV